MTRIIYCAGNQGRVVLDILRRGEFDGSVVFVDNEHEPGAKVNGVEVVGDYRQLEEFDPETDQCIVAIGGIPSPRLKLVNRVEKYGYGFYSAMDPDTTISPTSDTGAGVIINARTYIGPDTVVEPHVLIDSCVNISHDTHVKKGATITPNVTLAGGVTVGEKAYIGAGAIVIDDVSVGDEAVVGAGAVVTEDVAEDTTVVGIPADEK